MRIIKYVVFIDIKKKKKENTNQEEMKSYDIYIYTKSYHDQRMQCTGEFNALNHLSATNKSQVQKLQDTLINV